MSMSTNTQNITVRASDLVNFEIINGQFLTFYPIMSSKALPKQIIDFGIREMRNYLQKNPGLSYYPFVIPAGYIYDAEHNEFIPETEVKQLIQKMEG